MLQKDDLRIDKWLWAVRLYKTRSQAGEACKQGRILIDDVQVKPSRAVKIGDIVIIKRPPVNFQYKVLGLLEKRQSAKIAQEHVKDITPESEKEKLEMKRYTNFELRDRGAGRPTKRERRIIEQIKGKGESK